MLFAVRRPPFLLRVFAVYFSNEAVGAGGSTKVAVDGVEVGIGLLWHWWLLWFFWIFYLYLLFAGLPMKLLAVALK
jgi:hypothetical protein